MQANLKENISKLRSTIYVAKHFTIQAFCDMSSTHLKMTLTTLHVCIISNAILESFH